MFHYKYELMGKAIPGNLEKKKITYEREILDIIKSKGLSKITQIFSFYSGCCEKTFYNHQLQDLQSIKKALQDNRTKICQSMLMRWVTDKSNPTLQMAAYKILCDDDDRKKLSMQYLDNNINLPNGGINIIFEPYTAKDDNSTE